MLQNYCGILEDYVYESSQQNDPQAVVMLRSIHHGIRTLNAISTLLQSDLENACCAAALARGIFEASVRILWGTRKLNGSQDHWARLQKHWALEDKKWAEQARNFLQTQEHAEKIIEAREDIVNNDIEKAPPIEQMLRDIEIADYEQGINNSRMADFYYAICYRILCRAAHVHPAALRRPVIDDFIGQTRIACIMATNWFCQAICHIAAENKKEEIEKAVKQVYDLCKDRQYE